MVDSRTAEANPKRDTCDSIFEISIPVEAGNKAAKDGFSIIARILEQQKPEAAAYFIAENGMRTGIVVLEMSDVSQLPALAEPWFLGLNASIEATRHDSRRPQQGGTCCQESCQIVRLIHTAETVVMLTGSPNSISITEFLSRRHFLGPHRREK